jgi:hypothetical protein
MGASGRSSLTRGATPLARLVIWSWTCLHALAPPLVGGCRPIELREYLPGTRWRLDYAQVITRFAHDMRNEFAEMFRPVLRVTR